MSFYWPFLAFIQTLSRRKIVICSVLVYKSSLSYNNIFQKLKRFLNIHPFLFTATQNCFRLPNVAEAMSQYFKSFLRRTELFLN